MSFLLFFATVPPLLNPYASPLFVTALTGGVSGTSTIVLLSLAPRPLPDQPACRLSCRLAVHSLGQSRPFITSLFVRDALFAPAADIPIVFFLYFFFSFSVLVAFEVVPLKRAPRRKDSEIFSEGINRSSLNAMNLRFSYTPGRRSPNVATTEPGKVKCFSFRGPYSFLPPNSGQRREESAFDYNKGAVH